EIFHYIQDSRGHQNQEISRNFKINCGLPKGGGVCVALLREGFPRSFAQMFSLLQRWDAADPHELHTLQQRLTSAETAERHEAYDNHMFLARFFTEPEDKWLKHHFIQLALHSARKFKMDSGKREAEANLHMGQVYLEKGQLERAQEHYEVFYHLTMGRTWQDPSGRMHHSRSCEELQKLFTLLGQRLLQEQDYTHAIKMFNKAYQMAKECMHTLFTLTTLYKLHSLSIMLC
uniref:Tetratricopeptide repeat protein 29 n=1 Tax=Sinocyclocheilus rhinocerous TaxID=307959 RepID=A0A673K213_9TELE